MGQAFVWVFMVKEHGWVGAHHTDLISLTWNVHKMFSRQIEGKVVNSGPSYVFEQFKLRKPIILFCVTEISKWTGAVWAKNRRFIVRDVSFLNQMHIPFHTEHLS